MSAEILQLLEALFVECRKFGEVLATKGLINSKDIEEARSSKGSQVISVGLPAYSLLHEILRSVKANSVGLILSKVSIFYLLITFTLITKVFQFDNCILNHQETNQNNHRTHLYFLFAFLCR